MAWVGESERERGDDKDSFLAQPFDDISRQQRFLPLHC